MVVILLPLRDFLPRCSHCTVSGEDAGKGHTCLSGGEAVWLADQDKSRGCSLACVDEF